MRLRMYCLLLALLCCWAVPDSGFADDKILRLARVSDNPQKHYPRVKGLADYLSERMKHLGYTGSAVVFARNLGHLTQLMKEGKIDLVSETAYSAILLERACDARILLREWRDENSNYRSVLLKRKDSSISSIRDLGGKVVAFEDAGSTSAYYLPSQEITRAGFSLVRMDYPGMPVTLKEDEVGYVFAGQEINIAIWVQEGRVDAGAMSDLDVVDEDNVPGTVLPELDVFHRSPLYPRALLLSRGSLAKTDRETIQGILQKAHRDKEGVRVMDKYKHVSRYDMLPEEERKALDALTLQ